MKMYKLVYEYFYMQGDKVSSALGYFDNETEALKAWNACFNREDIREGFVPSGAVDDIKREYTFSCCGWREWYRLEEFEHDNKISSWGNHPSMLNKVDMTIKETVKDLSDKSQSLRGSSLNYQQGSPSLSNLHEQV